MTPPDQQETIVISSLDRLEGKVLAWTFFAGRPLRKNEGPHTRNTIQLPELHRVAQGRLESIFSPEKWIGDDELPEWDAAARILQGRGVQEIWSPVTIEHGSFLLGPGRGPEFEADGEIYRHEGLDRARSGSNPENMFRGLLIRRFIENNNKTR